MHGEPGGIDNTYYIKQKTLINRCKEKRSMLIKDIKSQDEKHFCNAIAMHWDVQHLPSTKIGSVALTSKSN